ncbi:MULTISPECIES: cupin domain-containing protein [unclassified Duganella]|uniref:cupin domain-containing protein n=1 Tax=unclassified Duganella TaxID=2636909 RepID=UPI000E340A52|nr:MULTISPECIES: cupin domain-containing protein [unclassified Duganella]RFP19041.1 cupin domain-containing protein [Duganella sp. BJB475]RFP35703.1 cupin domain-containing protein [Duganella sp. BJB476]
MPPVSFARHTLPAVAALLLAIGAGAVQAQTQASAIRRTVIQKADVSVPGREAVVARVELDAGATAGRHSHPGDEISYVMEGEGELRIDGEDPRRVKAGEAFVIPAGTVHDAINVGKGPLKLVGVYVVEKGKPLATPAK